MRGGSPDAHQVLSRQGRYQSVRDNLRVKEVRLDGDESGKHWIICHNPFEAERDLAKRTAALARVNEELERIATARTRDRTKRRSDDAHVKAECALRYHPTLGRWVRQLKSGRLRIDTLTGTAGTVTQTTPLTEIQQGIVDACGVAAPPRVAHLHPS